MYGWETVLSPYPGPLPSTFLLLWVIHAQLQHNHHCREGKRVRGISGMVTNTLLWQIPESHPAASDSQEMLPLAPLSLPWQRCCYVSGHYVSAHCHNSTCGTKWALQDMNFSHSQRCKILVLDIYFLVDKTLSCTTVLPTDVPLICWDNPVKASQNNLLHRVATALLEVHHPHTGIRLFHSSRKLAVGKPLHCPQHWATDKAGYLVQRQWNSDVKHL